MRRPVFGALALILALAASACVRSTKPAAPPRPASVPASASWAGGVDGGAFVLCAPQAPSPGHFTCTTWNDRTGERWTHGLHRLVRVAWGDGGPVHHPVEAPPSSLVYEGFDGETVLLSGGLALVPAPSAAAADSRAEPRLRVPAHGAHDEAWYRARVRGAEAIMRAFAAEHGWTDRVELFWRGGVEIHDDQQALWQRVLELHGVKEDRPLPTQGLTAALEKEVLLAVTPEAYARIVPDYAQEDRAYERLLAHEMVHRLHVSILGGDEEAMGPTWFYEGFAVVGSGALEGIETATAQNLSAFKAAKGPGAYARFAAALRYYLDCLPLPELVAQAKRSDLDAWLSARCPAQ